MSRAHFIPLSRGLGPFRTTTGRSKPYRSRQCRRRSRPPASGISYCRPPLDWLLSSDRFSSATKRAASPQRQNQCHDASREALCSANWGGPLHKQNSYRHHDQGFYAGHGNTETNLAHNSLKLELGLLVSHGASPAPFSTPMDHAGSRGIVPAAEPIIGVRDRLGSKGEEAPGPDEPFRMLRHKKAQHAGPKPRADSRNAARAGSV